MYHHFESGLAWYHGIVYNTEEQTIKVILLTAFLLQLSGRQDHVFSIVIASELTLNPKKESYLLKMLCVAVKA